eukprot:TRINITY_DN14534_c0_g1_i1.p1 TRINITY_DN14534_c0_g1~~TRINITY_DN14534_c0_g1_i1.p1  ORF type:complete len:282 (-),score=33.74 TRINITY_DN14534_c0_g1_i1:169-954(-)
MAELSENALHHHIPLYHSMQSDSNKKPACCPICRLPPEKLQPRGNYYVHLHNEHGPPEDREPHFPDFNAFAWVVCRRPSDGKFLLVHEPAGLCGGRPAFWLPAGRVDEGESFVEAAERETLEEGGVKCKITGVLQFRLGGGIVPRIVLLAEALEPRAEAKSLPNFESCGALWVDASAGSSDLKGLTEKDFRSSDPLVYYPKVASGTMRPHSLDTASFEALENFIRDLTSRRDLDYDDCVRKVKSVWKQLVKEYPKSCFEFE